MRIDHRAPRRKRALKVWADKHRIKAPKGFHWATPTVGRAARDLLRMVQLHARIPRTGEFDARTLALLFPQSFQDKAFAAAVSQLGVHEAGTSNVVKFSRWYGMVGPWCAMFCSWCYTAAGHPSFHYSYVPSVVGDARARRNGLTVTNHPQHGDLVCFDWNRDGVADHIGLFNRWESSGLFSTIEGNTSPANDSNGGQVMRRIRSTDTVLAFVHVR